jgi:hypothetical protein
LEYWLVLTLPVTLPLLAYWAGRQRDRVTAYAHDRGMLNHILRSLMYTPDPDLDQTLPQVLRHIGERNRTGRHLPGVAAGSNEP